MTVSIISLSSHKTDQTEITHLYNHDHQGLNCRESTSEFLHSDNFIPILNIKVKTPSFESLHEDTIHSLKAVRH